MLKAGAIGVIIINREPGLINMSPGDSGALCIIPAFFIDYYDGVAIYNAMQSGSVTAFMGTTKCSLCPRQ